MWHWIDFPKPFSSKPTVMVATKGLYANNGPEGSGFGWTANYDQVTVKKFKLQMIIFSARFNDYEVSWIACGGM